MRAKRRKMPETYILFSARSGCCLERTSAIGLLSSGMRRQMEAGICRGLPLLLPSLLDKLSVQPSFLSIGWSLAIMSLDWTIPWLLMEILWFFSSGLWLMAPPTPRFLCLYLSISESQPVALPLVTLSSQDQKTSQTSDSCSSLPKRQNCSVLPPFFFLYSKEIWFYLPQSSLLLPFLSTDREFPFNYSTRYQALLKTFILEEVVL